MLLHKVLKLMSREPDEIDDPFERFWQRRLMREHETKIIERRTAEIRQEDEADAIAVAQLRKIYPNGFPGGKPRQAEIQQPRELSTPVATAHASSAGIPVKDMILAILKGAYPDGLTAKQIKAKAAIKYGAALNPNTLTVTLVRYSKLPVPCAKCEGRVWCFVASPAANGNGAYLAQERKSPEVTGLL